MTTLSTLLAERHDLDALVDAQDGELTPDLEAAWDANTEAVPAKVESWGLWITRQEHLADAIDAEIARLRQRKAVVEHAIARSRAELQRQMTMGGIDKVKGVLVTVALQANPPAVKGELSQDALRDLHEDDGPAIVKLTPAVYTLDRKAALAAHKAGTPLPAGLTVEQAISLRIR
jgi:hypothetical protein